MISKLICAATIPECSKSVEENVVCSLVTHYDKNVPPPATGNQPVPINVMVELRHISDIDEEKHTISLVAYIALNWDDPRLKIPKKSLTMDLETIWIPDTYFQNSVQVKSIQNMKRNSGKSLFVSNVGGFSIMDALAITFECKMNFDQFPFDQQNCAFEILGTLELGTHSDPKVILNQITLHTLQGNTIETSSPNDETTFNSSGLPFNVQLQTPKPFFRDGNYNEHHMQMPVVTLDFHLVRKSEKFHNLIITYFVPSGAFAFLSLFSFFIKPEVVPGRMGMLVTIFLIVIGIYKSVEAPPNRGYGYLEKWYIGVQVPILFALLEYGLILAVLKYKDGHQEIVLWGNVWKINDVLKKVDLMSFCLSVTLLTFSIIFDTISFVQ